ATRKYSKPPSACRGIALVERLRRLVAARRLQIGRQHDLRGGFVESRLTFLASHFGGGQMLLGLAAGVALAELVHLQPGRLAEPRADPPRFGRLAAFAPVSMHRHPDDEPNDVFLLGEPAEIV